MENQNNNNKESINIDDFDILKHVQGHAASTKSREKKNNGKWAGAAVGGGIIAILAKFKAVLLVLLTKLKFTFVFLKFGKILSTFGSMLLMIWAEAMRYGWVFGVGFVLLIFAHEMGHYIAAKREGLNVGTPIFVPFVGAFISLKDSPESAFVEAKIAIAGPIVGSAAALMLIPVYMLTGSTIFLSLAFSGILINIFNLIPISPLDGGRVAAALSPKLWIAGLVLALGFFFITFSPILFLIVILGTIRLYNFWRNRENSYYELPIEQRIAFSVVYFGLIVILGVVAYMVYNIINVW